VVEHSDACKLYSLTHSGCICGAEPSPDLSAPGAPSEGEIAFRTKIISRRMQQLSGVLLATRAPMDDITGAALVALGVAVLARPTSEIDAAHLSALVAEMSDLGTTFARAATAKAIELAKRTGRS
jgi:hypothetical protein